MPHEMTAFPCLVLRRMGRACSVISRRSQLPSDPYNGSNILLLYLHLRACRGANEECKGADGQQAQKTALKSHIVRLLPCRKCLCLCFVLAPALCCCFFFWVWLFRFLFVVATQRSPHTPPLPPFFSSPFFLVFHSCFSIYAH